MPEPESSNEKAREWYERLTVSEGGVPLSPDLAERLARDIRVGGEPQGEGERFPAIPGFVREGSRVRFRDDHPEYPGMTGTVDAVFPPWLAGALNVWPGFSVRLDPVFAAEGDLTLCEEGP